MEEGSSIENKGLMVIKRRNSLESNILNVEGMIRNKGTLRASNGYFSNLVQESNGTLEYLIEENSQPIILYALVKN